MKPHEVLAQLRASGVRVILKDDALVASRKDALGESERELIRTNRDALVRELRALKSRSDAIRSGALHVCINCRAFELLSRSEPDGWCWHYDCETWSEVVFMCPAYESLYAQLASEQERIRQ